MDKRGLIKKTHGGARRVEKNTPTSLDTLPSHTTLVDRLTIEDDPHLYEKREIAKTAASLVCSGDVVFLGSGLTCAFLAKEIKHLSNLTVVTASVNIVNELAPYVSLILLGGDIHVRKNHVETLGDYTIDVLNTMFFDKSFFTVDGVDLDFGYSILNRKQIPLYEHLYSHSSICYLLLDSSKFGKQTFARLSSLDKFNNVITDEKTPKMFLNNYQDNNINVYIASDKKHLNK